MASADRLSGALEDYLETVYELVRDRKVARVRDIARARGVRAASVTPAMRRLAGLGLVRYGKREYIDLTPKGQLEAQRVFSRHQALTRFFERVLRMPEEAVEGHACAMEHSLSPRAMDYLVRFIEFLHNCPEGTRLLKLFHGCAVARRRPTTCRGKCPLRGTDVKPKKPAVPLTTFARAQLSAGDRADGGDPAARPNPGGSDGLAFRVGTRVRVRRIATGGAVRDRLLDAGLLPDAVVEVVGVANGGARYHLRLGGFDVQLTRKQARALLVTSLEDP